MASGRRIAGAFLVGLAAWVSPADSCSLTAGNTYSVARVPDGETVVLDDGTTVRLLAILAPRAEDADGDPDIWQPALSSRAALEALVAGRTVALSQPRKRDRHQRLPAHLLVLDGPAPVWVQQAMVAAGHARVAAPIDGDDCAGNLISPESDARAAGRGLWAQPAYQPVDASMTLRLLQRRDTFQVVLGRVVRVAAFRGTTYLEFGGDWRSDFTVAIPDPMKRRLGAIGANLASLQGKRIEVRGWIERRNGPLVTLTQAEHLRIVDEGP